MPMKMTMHMSTYVHIHIPDVVDSGLVVVTVVPVVLDVNSGDVVVTVVPWNCKYQIELEYFKWQYLLILTSSCCSVSWFPKIWY